MQDFNSRTVTENLEIDEFNLDEELKTQSSVYFKYAAMLAEADAEVRCKKEAVDIVEAEADMRVRNTATGKITEALVKTLVAQDNDVLEAHRLYIDAVHNKNLIDAAVKAFDQRKSCLDNLVRLHTTQYFAEPKEQIMAKAAEQTIHQENVKRIVRDRLNKA